jgi:hypothetical protein
LKIWQIVTQFEDVFVFFEKAYQVEEYSKSGKLEEIRYDYFNFLKKYDEFDLYKYDEFMIKFDSKEVLERDFKGNMFAYLRQ